MYFRSSLTCCSYSVCIASVFKSVSRSFGGKSFIAVHWGGQGRGKEGESGFLQIHSNSHPFHHVSFHVVSSKVIADGCLRENRLPVLMPAYTVEENGFAAIFILHL